MNALWAQRPVAASNAQTYSVNLRLEGAEEAFAAPIDMIRTAWQHQLQPTCNVPAVLGSCARLAKADAVHHPEVLAGQKSLSTHARVPSARGS